MYSGGRGSKGWKQNLEGREFQFFRKVEIYQNADFHPLLKNRRSKLSTFMEFLKTLYKNEDF